MKYIDRYFLSCTSNPYYLWKIEIPKEISAKVECTGSIYKESGGEQEQVTAHLSWKLGLIEDGEILFEGEEEIYSIEDMSLAVNERSRPLWPSWIGRHEEGILINHVGNGNLEISFNQKVINVLKFDESKLIDANLTSTLYCNGTKLDGQAKELLYRHGRTGTKAYRWDIPEDELLKITLSLAECPFEEGQKEITCSLKVVINVL